MAENPRRNFDEIFASLNEAQQEVCMLLSASDWQSGVGDDFLQAMGVSMVTVDELVKNGIIERGEDRKFVREYVEENRARAEKVLADLSIKQPSAPRFRLFSQDFQDFVFSQMEE